MKTDIFWIPGPWLGRLAIASRPRGGDWLHDEVADWRSAGVDVVVSLLEAEEATQLGLSEESRAAEANGIEFVHFPIPDRGVPASSQDALALTSRIVSALNTGKSIAVHCRQGVGRSGLIVAGVLMSSGISPADSIDAVSTARGIAIPETSEQRRWLEELSQPLHGHVH